MTPESPTPEAPIDLGVLVESVGDDADTHLELLLHFRHMLRESLIELMEAHRRGFGGDVAAVAHRLKGSARALGAARLSSLLQEVEDSALLNRFEKASEALQHLESEASRACRWIGDYEHLSAGATGP